MSETVTTGRATLTDLLAGLEEVDDRGIWFEGSFTPWRDHLRDARIRAAALRSLLPEGAPPHVGVLLPNCTEFSSLFAGAAMGGFVLVGLNSTRRGAALAADVVRADCQVVLTSPDTAGLLDPAVDVRTIDVESAEWATLLAGFGAADFEPRTPAPDDLTMLIFTSGTTGHPKAVRCSQRKFAEPGSMLAERFSLGPEDVVYLSMPMFHSNSQIAGWSVAAASGASVVIRRTFSASGFGDDVRRYRVTYANYVGKPLHYILATPERPDDPDTSLRIVYGNEASAADRLEFARRFGARVVDGFGSTEAGAAITRTPDTPNDALGPLREPVLIVDPQTDEPVPAGVVGEIVNSSGPGYFDGYYGDPAATAERMRGGMYRTGDLGWVDEKGFIHFAGRLGDWLRIDGENIGTQPIEAVLRRHPLVRECIVFGVPVEIGDAVGAVLVAPGLTRAGFDGFLTDQPDLGRRQRPTRVWLVDELPQTATFKVAKAAVVTSLGAPTWSG